MAAPTSGKLSHDLLYQKYSEIAQKQEATILELTEELHALQNGTLLPSTDSEDSDKLRSANSKLKYRIGILKNAVEEANKNSGSMMLNLVSALSDLFGLAICSAFPDLPERPVMISLSKVPKLADYQCNSAMTISQLLKAQGIKMNPREVADKILAEVMPNDIVAELSVAGPGFINIILKKEFIEKNVNAILKRGVVPPKVHKKRVVVDFSAPNIAKQMHVGHLRSTIIGDSISRLLEFLGHDVLRLNHVGDWGTQFGMLIAHLKEEFPDFLTSPPPIADLQQFYKESKKRFDEDEEFKKRAYSSVVQLQNYEEESFKAWKLICDISRKEFQVIYDRLDVTLEERGESYYQQHMKRLVADLKDKQMITEDEGRYVMFGDGCPIPLTIIKSDGGFTYDTSDMACIRQRIQEENADWIVYVTDAGQAVHFQTIFACAEKCDILDRSKVRIDHVGFGVVLGEDKKKFKTRSGDTVKLADLLEEGLKRSSEKLAEKERDKVLSDAELKAAQEAVAYGCIKYADLCHNRNHDYIFSFDKMLDDRGNTAAYLLYALTRIRSIARKANVSEKELRSSQHVLRLDDPKELKLGKVLIKFPEVIEKITEDLCMHTLCEYLYEVSTVFTEFYDSCQCVVFDKNTSEVTSVNMSRVQLCDATSSVMEKCFSILGIKTVEKM